MSVGRRVVVSIHPRHANRIYAGAKTFEFRRVGAGFVAGDVILIYETAPTGAITGFARIDYVLRLVEVIEASEEMGFGHLSPAEMMARLESERSERAHVERYLNGASSPVALRLAEASRFIEPRPLSQVGLRRAPQSYQFLGA